MSHYVKLGAPTDYGKVHDANGGKFKSSRGSYGYGRPPLPKGSTEFPDWILEASTAAGWWGVVFVQHMKTY